MAVPAVVRTAEPRISLSGLLLLADGRLPTGGHAHSGGLEAAVAAEGVASIQAIEGYLHGRAQTTGRVAAAFAAAACAAVHDPEHGAARRLETLDQELDARMPSPALRAVSRRLGRQLLRAALRFWPHPVIDELAAGIPRGAHQAVALGAVAASAGIDPPGAATAAAYESAATPAAAAVRLLGLDPFAVYAILARLGPTLDAIAADASAAAQLPPADLPAHSAPLLDLLAEQHAAWEVRLFAS